MIYFQGSIPAEIHVSRDNRKRMRSKHYRYMNKPHHPVTIGSACTKKHFCFFRLQYSKAGKQYLQVLRNNYPTVPLPTIQQLQLPRRLTYSTMLSWI